MKRFSFCLAMLVIFSFGLAHAQAPGNTFIRLGTVFPQIGIDTIPAGATISFPIMYGNRDTNSYALSNAFLIYSDTTMAGTSRGSGTANWAFATGNGGNVKMTAPANVMPGIWVDTVGFIHKDMYDLVFKFNLWGADGSGVDTVMFSGAIGPNTPPGMPVKDSGVFFNLKILTKVADHGKIICIDSSAKYPPTGAWKWPAIYVSPSYNTFPTWSGAHCFRIVDPNHPPNRAPVLAPIGSQTVNEGQPLVVIANATDPDGTIPSLSASPLPTGASFVDNGNGSAQFSWTPGFNQAGVYNVRFIASDGTLADTELVAITVVNVNHPPVLDPIGPKTVAEAANLNFGVTASDPDSDPLTFSASPLPLGATFNTSTGIFDWTPTYLQAGLYNVWFAVSDGTLADSELVAITVTDVNRAPVLGAIGDKSVMVGEFLAINVAATDPDGTKPALTAAPLPTNATFTDNGNGLGSFGFTPAADQVGPHNVTFVASDGALADTEIVTITVTPRANFLVLSPDTLKFVWDLGQHPQADSFHVAKGGDSEIDYTASTTSDRIFLSNASGTTPGYVNFDIVNISTIPVGGPYKDSIKVSGTGVPDKYEYILLTVKPCPEYQLSKATFADTIFAGESAAVSDSIEVTSTGRPLPFLAFPSAGFTFITGSGTTPGKIRFAYSEQFSEIGSFQRCFTVVDGAHIPEDPCQPHALVCINIVVNNRPCVALLTSDTVLSFTAVQGDEIAAPFSRQFTVSSSDPTRNFAFEAKAPIGVSWIVFDTAGTPGPHDGTTPGTVLVQVRPDSLGIGPHVADVVVSSLADEVCLPKMKTVRISLTVTRRPSADTVLVENKPAVPGQTMMVPVNLLNSCPLKYAEVSLKFDATALHLAGVSYGGSKVDYVTNKGATINNTIGKVTLTIDVGAQSLVPAGFGNWATLMFVVRPEAALGVYPITLAQVPDTSLGNPWFKRDCGQGTEDQFPEFVPGGVLVDQIPNSVCGYVVDTNGTQIPGATVQLWGDFPNGSPEMITTSSDIGSFFFSGVTSVPFDLYAYADGFYPGRLDNLNFEAKGVKIVLKPLGHLNTTSQWVDYYCNDNMYLNAPLPIGSVVEAYSPSDLLVGRFVVNAAGKYGFMPVYRANGDFGDTGAHTGDNIRFFVDGIQALTTGNTIYPADYAKVEVCVKYGAQVTKTCTLQEGWNLVSWNVQTETFNILDVLGPYMNCIDVVLGFEQGGLTYDPTLPEFSTLWSVDHLSGYWIKVKPGCPVTLNLKGLPVPFNTPIPVTTGWNLVSYLPDGSLTPGIALQSIYDKLLFAYGWDNGIQIFKPGSEFNTLTQMKTCNGYWVKITSDGTLIYPSQNSAPMALHPRLAVPVQSLSSVGMATPTWVNLYATNLKLDGQTVGAGATIEAFSAVSNAKVGSFTMKADGKLGFMPVYADGDEADAGLRPGGQFYLTVNGTKTKEAFTWTTNGDRMMVAGLSSGNSTGTLPDGFSLNQNYPNPFNPTTTISFTVPVNTRARIEIYNVLGALIAVPYDDAVQAGEHSILWDGRNQNGETVSSGVYLYKLISDGYSEARKMMLLK